MTATSAPRPSAADPAVGRPLRADERAVLERLCAVLPGAADLLAGLDSARVRETTGWSGSSPVRSVSRVEHRGADEPAVLPVRGFAVDERGRPVGEVVVWAADGDVVGLRVRAAAGRSAPPRLDADMLDAVPWS